MKDKEIQIESSVERVFEEHRAKQIKKDFRKKKRKIFLLACLFGFLSAFLIYFLSDASKIKGIEVEGNHWLSDDKIIELSGLSENSNSLLIFDLLIQKNLSKEPLITSSSVSLSNQGIVTIEVKEKELIGYRYLDKPEMITKDGTLIEMSNEYASFLSRIPLITGFYDEDGALIQKLAKAFSEVDQKKVEQIAEIHQVTYSYDEYGIQCIMQDGNEIYGSFYSMEMLNSYNEVVSALKGKKSCIYIDEMSGNPYTSLCPDELKELENQENIDENSEKTE